MRRYAGVVLLFVLAVPACAQSDADAIRRAAIIADAARLLHEQDTFAAVQRIQDGNDPADVMASFDGLSTQLYWKNKDLSAAIAIARAGVQYGLTAAPGAEDEALATALRSGAKALSYNVASFTWPGWDEPGIEITRSDVLIGLDAAKTNLRLAQELEKPDIALSRAYWMLAAVQLALDEHESAHTGFLTAVDYARKAGEAVEAANSVACACLAAHLAAPIDAGKREALDAAKAALKAAGDDGFFLGQIETAERVFAPGR